MIVRVIISIPNLVLNSW